MMPSFQSIIRVPEFRRLCDYYGAWAIEARAAAALWEAASRIDLTAHVNETPPKLHSQIEKVAARGTNLAIIKIAGPMMKQADSMSGGVSTVQLRRDIRQAAADPDVAGILLAIDSPGGTVAGTEDLARDVLNARKQKPVWAQIEDMGASAAYWIASQTDRIFANGSTALIGSIGTLAVLYDLSARAEKEGVKALVYSTGPLKGAGVEGTPITDEQAGYFQGLVDDAQRTFDAAVKKGRGLSEKQLADVRSGAVFGADEALRKKLIDGIQPLEATLDALATEARKAKRETSRGANVPAPQKETAMTFEAWLTQNGFDPNSLEVRDRADLLELYNDDQRKQASANGASQTATATAIDLQQTREQLAAETQRVHDIRRICLAASNPTIKTDDGETSLEAHAILNGWDRNQTELHVLRQSRPAPAAIVRSHDRDCGLEALQGALLLRAGGRLDHPAYQSQAALYMKLPQWMRANINAEQRQRAMEAAHRYSDLSAVDLCREALRLDGKDVPGTRSDLIRAAFSGGALTNIFTTSMNAILLSTYMEIGDTTGGWTSTVDVADFKTNERHRLAKGPNLAKLPRGGEADHYDRSDKKESYKIARYAKQFVVDEQDIIDDSMNAFAETPREMGLAAARLRPDLVYALLIRNAALDVDSVALFHADHSNLNTTAALTHATVKTAITALEKQRESSINLGLRATHLIVPPDLKHDAAQIINSSQIAWGADNETERGTLNTINSEENLTLVTDPRLSNGVDDPVDGVNQAGSTTTWFMASSMGHNIEVGYLRGTGRAPQTRSWSLVDGGRYGMGWDVNLDIGAKALDFRGLSKNTA